MAGKKQSSTFGDGEQPAAGSVRWLGSAHVRAGTVPGKPCAPAMQTIRASNMAMSEQKAPTLSFPSDITHTYGQREDLGKLSPCAFTNPNGVS